MDEAKAPPKAQPREHRLGPDRCQQAEFKRHDWVVNAEVGVNLEVLKDESYWANYASKFQTWDRVEVRTDDGLLWAELLVLACGRTWAKMHILRHAKLTSADVEQTQLSGAATAHTFRYAFRGPNKRHCVVRSDGEPVFEEGPTKADAVEWAKKNRVELTNA